MKLKSLICLALFCFAVSFLSAPAQAQSHSAALTWTLSTDDTTANCNATGATCSQNVYRAPGACTQSAPVFTLLGSPAATVAAFTDSTITPGTWCYAVTFVLNGTESVKDTAQVSLQPASPSALAVVAK
jgi:hypothetical protein